MKQSTVSKQVCLFALVILWLSPGQVSAGPAKKPILGDWQLQVDFNGRKMTSILSLTNDGDDGLKGEVIAFWGISPLRDVRLEGNQLSFVQVNRFRNEETTTNFAGTIRRGRLSGTFSSDRGQFQAEGTRMRRMPTAAGNWELKLRMGDREFTSVLAVKQNEDRTLSADWQSQWGEHAITNVRFKANKLAFDRKSKAQDRQWESTFEGTIKGGTLTGVINSDRGEISVEGKRIGAPIVGLWELDIASDSGTRKQLLRIYPDLSALYGPLAVKKVDFDNGQIAFKTSLNFGNRTFDINFAGRVKGRKLTGEITTSRGTQQVTGQRRRPAGAGQRAAKAQQAPHEPDVIYVPTPPLVVDKMLEMAHVTKDDLVYDLGCGDGRIVVTAAKKYGCKAVGFDVDPRRIKESLANVKENNVGDLVRIEQKDIFTLDLSKANVITLYLLPELNVKLIPQLEKLKPGSRIVSHDFDMRGVKPDKVVEVSVNDQYYDQHTIYLWTTPLKKENAGDE
ncbi:MAG: methyltransferase domain-containing protein [Sedimentisphaerales bacterium]|jgi:tRNA G37 N-methylase Trm5